MLKSPLTSVLKEVKYCEFGQIFDDKTIPQTADKNNQTSQIQEGHTAYYTNQKNSKETKWTRAIDDKYIDVSMY